MKQVVVPLAQVSLALHLCTLALSTRQLGSVPCTRSLGQTLLVDSVRTGLFLCKTSGAWLGASTVLSKGRASEHGLGATSQGGEDKDNANHCLISLQNYSAQF